MASYVFDSPAPPFSPDITSSSRTSLLCSSPLSPSGAPSFLSLLSSSSSLRRSLQLGRDLSQEEVEGLERELEEQIAKQIKEDEKEEKEQEERENKENKDTEKKQTDATTDDNNIENVPHLSSLLSPLRAINSIPEDATMQTPTSSSSSSAAGVVSIASSSSDSPAPAIALFSPSSVLRNNAHKRSATAAAAQILLLSPHSRAMRECMRRAASLSSTLSPSSETTHASFLSPQQARALQREINSPTKEEEEKQAIVASPLTSPSHPHSSPSASSEPTVESLLARLEAQDSQIYQAGKLGEQLIEEMESMDQQFQRENAEKEQVIEQNEKRIQELEKEIKQLKINNNNKQQQQSEKDVSADSDRPPNPVDVDERQTLSRRVQFFEASCNEYKRSLAAAQEEVYRLDGEWKKSQGKCTIFETANANLQRKITEGNKEQQQETQRRTEWNTEKNTMQQRIQHLESSCESLRQAQVKSVEELRVAQLDLSRSNAECTAMQRREKDLQRDVSALRAQLEQANSKIEKEEQISQAAMTKLNMDVEELRDELEKSNWKCREEMEKFETISAQLLAANQSISSLKAAAAAAAAAAASAAAAAGSFSSPLRARSSPSVSSSSSSSSLLSPSLARTLSASKREKGHNKRLSGLHYSSLLHELEAELNEENALGAATAAAAANASPRTSANGSERKQNKKSPQDNKKIQENKRKSISPQQQKLAAAHKNNAVAAKKNSPPGKKKISPTKSTSSVSVPAAVQEEVQAELIDSLVVVLDAVDPLHGIDPAPVVVPASVSIAPAASTIPPPTPSASAHARAASTPVLSTPAIGEDEEEEEEEDLNDSSSYVESSSASQTISSFLRSATRPSHPQHVARSSSVSATPLRKVVESSSSVLLKTPSSAQRLGNWLSDRVAEASNNLRPIIDTLTKSEGESEESEEEEEEDKENKPVAHPVHKHQTPSSSLLKVPSSSVAASRPPSTPMQSTSAASTALALAAPALAPATPLTRVLGDVAAARAGSNGKRDATQEDTLTAAAIEEATNAAASASSSSSSSPARADVLREYFHLATLSVKLSSVDDNVRRCNASAQALYEEAVDNDVPFAHWHAWINMKLAEKANQASAHEILKPRTPSTQRHRTAVNTPAAATTAATLLPMPNTPNMQLQSHSHVSAHTQSKLHATPVRIKPFDSTPHVTPANNNNRTQATPGAINQHSTPNQVNKNVNRINTPTTTNASSVRALSENTHVLNVATLQTPIATAHSKSSSLLSARASVSSTPLIAPSSTHRPMVKGAERFQARGAPSGSAAALAHATPQAQTSGNRNLLLSQPVQRTAVAATPQQAQPSLAASSSSSTSLFAKFTSFVTETPTAARATPKQQIRA